MASNTHTPPSPPAGSPFVHVHGRSRLYDRAKQGIKRLSPSWFVRAVQVALGPCVRARSRAAHRRLIERNLPEEMHATFLAMYTEARRRWDRGERSAADPMIEWPLGRSGHRVWVRPGTCDVILYDDIVVQEQYGSVPLEGVRTILDAGANIGMSGAYLLWKCPNARLIALEPDPVNHAQCARNLAAFGERAVVLRAGLWGRSCRIKVEGTNVGTWASTTAAAAPEDRDGLEAFDVATLMKRYGMAELDVLKIDIEGAELGVFEAGNLDWLDRVRCIQIELENDASRTAFFHAIAGRGFELQVHRETTVAFRSDWGA